MSQPHAKPLPGPVNEYGMAAYPEPHEEWDEVIVIECPVCDTPYIIDRGYVSFHKCFHCGSTFAPPHQFAWMLLPIGKRDESPQNLN